MKQAPDEKVHLLRGPLRSMKEGGQGQPDADGTYRCLGIFLAKR